MRHQGKCRQEKWDTQSDDNGELASGVNLVVLNTSTVSEISHCALCFSFLPRDFRIKPAHNRAQIVMFSRVIFMFSGVEKTGSLWGSILRFSNFRARESHVRSKEVVQFRLYPWSIEEETSLFRERKEVIPI